ncbi:Pseudouridine synthase RluC [Helicobacter sp. NHP19-012]|uniref:RNA pseudouridylate synthase n=1 Tax=Helicobacter gastrofelis TaxID=2849642 RepID=A0ABN6I7D6_9HELI|nr:MULTISPECIES: RluA family pseudouridine synthase [unclassified Helicobacter]BCZ18524.1 Pseudouridine synthase RluC [Helicobacter sp. NHP19-012]GMB95798.1 Pseudouridine synthase RluC [Helicobacter sp. NHP22-001]
MLQAYKVLAKQLTISHKEAKRLIDKGLVSVAGQRLKLARALIASNAPLSVLKCESQVLAKETEFLALNKAQNVSSFELERTHKPYQLCHRLDQSTSGVLLLGLGEFYKKALEAFKERKVYKEYLALVQGVLDKPLSVSKNLSVQKSHTEDKKGFVRAFVDKKGKRALTHITPIKTIGQMTLLKVVIETGVTHQIRAHLAHLKHPIVGDIFYGAKPNQYFFLHAFKLELLGLKFQAPLPPYFKDCCELLEHDL